MDAGHSGAAGGDVLAAFGEGGDEDGADVVEGDGVLFGEPVEFGFGLVAAGAVAVVVEGGVEDGAVGAVAGHVGEQAQEDEADVVAQVVDVGVHGFSRSR
ncbi:hypothetical protein EMIT0232MI5_10526 [Pseudomonas sp. IT-232MI5]